MNHRMLMIDDHPMVRRGYAALLQQPGLDVTLFEADTVVDGIDLLQRVADIRMILYDWELEPGKGGLPGLIALRQMCPSVPLVVVSGLREQAIPIVALGAGAVSFLSKTATPQQVREHIEQHMATTATPTDVDPSQEPVAPPHPVALTSRQLSVLQLMAMGLGNRLIAHRLQISYATARAHVSAVMHTLGAHNRTEAVVMARKLGLLAC